MAEETKEFSGFDQKSAMAALQRWMGDGKQHGALKVYTIKCVQRGAIWVATITFEEVK